MKAGQTASLGSFSSSLPGTGADLHYRTLIAQCHLCRKTKIPLVRHLLPQFHHPNSSHWLLITSHSSLPASQAQIFTHEGHHLPFSLQLQMQLVQDIQFYDHKPQLMQIYHMPCKYIHTVLHSVSVAFPKTLTIALLCILFIFNMTPASLISAE